MNLANEALKNPNLFRRIENTLKSEKEDYEKALKAVGELKGKMTKIEQRASQRNRGSKDEDMNDMRCFMESLDLLADAQILRSGEAWMNFEKLKNECDEQNVESPKLDELRMLCVQREQLAADLLCYTLGFIKNTE